MGFLNFQFILLILTDLVIFYSPLEEKYPNFLFTLRMAIKQVIEGILGIALCLIPRYENKGEKEEKKKK